MNPGAGRRPGVIPYDPDVAAPVVVILAAGQGTRMRSATPKLLHEVCGRAIIAWPVAAARAAGARRIVVVEGPERPLGATLDGEVTFAVQEQPRGTADAVRAAAAHIDPASTVIVLNGDHPLITGGTLTGLAEAHARSGAAATLATAVLEDPSGYGRVVRAPDGTVERVVETKAPGDATELELHIREISTGIYAFEGAALLAALEEVKPHNAQGELYLPDVLPVLRGPGADRRRPRDHRRERARGQRPRPAGERPGDRAAPNPQAPHAGRGDDRRPRHDGDRRRRADRSGRCDRAVHQPARHDRGRPRRAGRPAQHA